LNLLTKATTVDIFLLALICGIVGFVLGWLMHAKVLADRLLEDPDSMIKALQDYKEEEQLNARSTSANVRELEVEQKDGVFYLYAKDNGQFLSQASTLDDALELVYERFPNQEFQGVISKEDAKRMGLS
jgi:hypothetical protein